MFDDLMLRTEDQVIRTMRAALACVEPMLEWARANGLLERVVPWVVEREHALVVAYDKPAPTE